jgi:glutaredoxin
MLSIDVLYYEDCPHYKEAVQALKEVLEQENVEARVNMVKVAKGGEAEAFGFIGSPTILINGKDVEPGMDDTSLFQGHCRIYVYKEDMFEYPPKDMIREALKRLA